MTERIRTHKQLEHDLVRARQKIETLERQLRIQSTLLKERRQQIQNLTVMLRGPKQIAVEFARSLANMIEASQ